jgi:hypothetical protein
MQRSLKIVATATGTTKCAFEVDCHLGCQPGFVNSAGSSQ